MALGPQFWGRWIAAIVNGLGDAAPQTDVTSWFRDVGENARAGGHPRSQHLWGLALDIVPPAMARGGVQSDLERLGFTVIDEGDHLHIQTFPAGVV